MPRKAPHKVNGDEIVSRAVIALFMREPFFAHILSGVRRRIDETTPTAAVALGSHGVEMRLNPDFIAGLTREQRIGVLKHEVLHLVLKHLTRAHGRDPLRWNLACDVVVNELVGPGSLPLGAIRRETFRNLEIPADATAEQVYDMLSSQSIGEIHSIVSMWVQHRTAPSSTGASDAAPEDLGDKAGTDPKAVGGHSDHSAWDGRDLGSSPSAEAAEAMIDDLIIRSADRSAASWGSLSGVVRECIHRARERNKPNVDWRRALRIFSAGAGRTRLVTSRRRESPRYGRTTIPGVAEDPKMPSSQRLVPGNKVKRLLPLLVAVDTSGSIPNHVLKMFFDEIDAIWRLGYELTVVTCDAAVQTIFSYKGSHSISIIGRGGTDFDPVFAWVRERSAQAFGGIIYLTDGFAPKPEIRPTPKVLWVVTDPEGMGNHLWFGRQIYLDPGAT